MDDLVVKSKIVEEHLVHLEHVMRRCREYSLKMNPLKCAFGVSSGKFLGFLVHQKGIDIDLTKAKAILEMNPLVNLKELKSYYVGKISYLRSFIPSLSEVLKPMIAQTKKGVKFIWNQDCEDSFWKIQEVLADPYTMISPSPDKPLLLYIANSEQSVGALLVQEDEHGKEKPVYYISRLMRGPELRYSMAKKICLSLVFAV